MMFSKSQNLVLWVLLMFAAGCTQSSAKKEETEWKTVAADNFTMKIPKHLKEATALHEEAVLQFQNPIKEYYCIVLQEGETAFRDAIEGNSLTEEYPITLDGYAKLIVDNFSENVEEFYTKPEVKPIRINGHDGSYFEVEVKVSGIDIYYNYGFVKGDTSYYQIITWTLRDRKTRYADDMLNTLESFKEN